jgi:hypothetical protein
VNFFSNQKILIMKRIKILLLIICVAAMNSACKKGDSATPTPAGNWTVSTVSIEQGDLPAEYSSLLNASATFSGSSYTIGNLQGTFSYTPDASGNAEGTLTLSPDIYTGGESSYKLVFQNNQMTISKNAADPGKTTTNKVMVVFSKQ